ncbi:MAG: hypothetical protein GY798_28275 [Hyphomicrobiales bacterium]|nr:hypothetical protein [Hyphomicrobiales bacterium]
MGLKRLPPVAKVGYIAAMKELTARAGERTKILHVFSDSIPQTVRFAARRITDGGSPDGTVEVIRRRWFRRQPPQSYRLRTEQKFHKRFADVDYAIYVTPDHDVSIAFQTRHLERSVLLWIIGGIVALAVLSALFVPQFLS